MTAGRRSCTPGSGSSRDARSSSSAAAYTLHGEVLAQRFFGRREIRLWSTSSLGVMDVIEAIGHIPLPPYIKRPDLDLGSRALPDRVRAGAGVDRRADGRPALHRPSCCSASMDAGVERVEITLHVGYGTFKPVRVDDVEAHTVDPEVFSIDEAAARRINAALDSAAAWWSSAPRRPGPSRPPSRAGTAASHAGQATTDLFIHPGYDFRAVGRLADEFPPALFVAADAGVGVRRAGNGPARVRARRSRERYRFYSYGDAMLVL